VRRFAPRQVPHDALMRVLAAASQVPSGGNIQPWHIYVLDGGSLVELKQRVAARVGAGDRDRLEVATYPSPLVSPYRERMQEFGKFRYGALGISPDDHAARAQVRAENGSVLVPRPLCSATSTAICQRPNGVMLACTCRPSCCCYGQRACTAAHRSPGRNTTALSPKSSILDQNEFSTAVCQLDTPTQRGRNRRYHAPRYRRPSLSCTEWHAVSPRRSGKRPRWLSRSACQVLAGVVVPAPRRRVTTRW
jgi:nitroreductase